MNLAQALLMNLAGDDTLEMPEDPIYTDITEACLSIALVGRNVFRVCEKLTALDFADPDRPPPFLFQGLFSHVPCQIVSLTGDGDIPGIILSCSRAMAGTWSGR